MKSKTPKALMIVTALHIWGCAANSNYSFQKRQRNSSEITIYGTMKDAGTGTPLPGLVIYGAGDSERVQADGNGKYRLSLKSGRKSLRAAWIGYYGNKTSKLSLAPGDSIQINFLMKEDNRPLID